MRETKNIQTEKFNYEQKRTSEIVIRKDKTRIRKRDKKKNV